MPSTVVNRDLYARQTEHGVQAECPTTHQEYISTTAKVSADGRTIWLLCACCDALRQTEDAYDPTAPQWHCYLRLQ